MYFGKLCTICAYLASSLFFTSNAQALSDEESYQNALKQTYEEFSNAVAKLEDKTAECSKHKPVNASKVNEQLPTTVEEQDLKLALAFLEDRNVSNCIHNARTNAVFTLSSLELLIEDLKEKGLKLDDESRNIKGFYGIVGGTSPGIAYMRAKYNALPKDLRSNIESITELQQDDFHPFELFNKIIKLRNKTKP